MDMHRRASKIFLAVSKLSPDEHASYLDDVCGDDAALRSYVEKLLAHDRNDSFPGSLRMQAESAGPPSVIGDFRILREIGRGGMGTVFEAEQVSLHRRVALKVLPSHLSLSDEAVRKFYREAEAGGRQSHRGIVAVHAVGEHEGFHFIAQELVEDGTTLSDELDRLRAKGMQPPGYFRDTAAFVAEVAAALEHAHRSGVIHRDIKPSNILISKDRKPKVTDFGLAKVEDALALSRTGEFAGTPYYMSPEQAMSKRVEIDRRTDIYSLGVTLYEMLTLRRPFEGKTTHEILKKIVLIDPSDPHKTNPKVPRDLSVICSKAMEKEPARRYQSMEEFGADLERFLHGDAVLAKPAGLAVLTWKRVKRNPVVSVSLGVAIVAAIGFVLYMLLWAYPQIRHERDVAEAERKKEVEARDAATEQRNIAETEKQKAIAAEQKAEIQLKQIIRLSDLTRLSNLETESTALWPAYPEIIDELMGWQARAEELLDRLETHRQTLEVLRQNAMPYDEAANQKDRESHPAWSDLIMARKYREWLAARIATIEKGGGIGDGDEGDSGGDKVSKEELESMKQRLAGTDKEIAECEVVVSTRRTWEFDKIEDQWQHDRLAELVAGLEWLEDEDEGSLKSVKDRLDFALTVKKRSIDDHQEAWDHAIASIANTEECPQYDGLVIKPQIGFVPIGQDPNTGLWEFAHLQTGEIPERGEDGALIVTEEMGMVFVLIPGGVFNMGAMLPSESNPVGSPNVDPSALIKEGPVHSVTVEPFFMSKYETTQGQWWRFTKRNPSWSQAGKTYGGTLVNLLHPVEQVSWEECDRVLFCLKLRLPSEAEWEYATRAGTTTVYWTGNDKKSLEGAVNLSDFYTKTHEGSPAWDYEEWLNDGCPTTAPVGSYDPNPFGLHDVHGNVWECCRDSHSLTYASTPTDGSAFESRDSSEHIIRGGSWAEGAEPCRSASRNTSGPGDRDLRIGFRSASSLQ